MTGHPNIRLAAVLGQLKLNTGDCDRLPSSVQKYLFITLQDCAIKFMDYVIEKFPFRISTVRADRGHEFQARFHWHVEDQGIRHVYIKPRTPQLNGKAERSHRTDQTEFYQLLTYTDDVDLNSKLEAWENFYNYDRPHISLDGKTPYEVMKSLLK